MAIVVGNGAFPIDEIKEAATAKVKTSITERSFFLSF
jgi:hypothetical protein